MLETLTKLKRAIPASLKASSKLESFSLCLPTPFVTKAVFGIKLLLIANRIQGILIDGFVKLGTTQEETG